MSRDIFQAIAYPTRRAIITLIALAPNAIVENFHTICQAISTHLRMLAECEIVKQEQMQEVDEWLTQFRKIWETRFISSIMNYQTLKNIKNEQ